MSDIEGSEPNWRSCEGSSEQVWATSEFQLGERSLKVFDNFLRDNVGIGKISAIFEASRRAEVRSLPNEGGSSLNKR